MAGGRRQKWRDSSQTRLRNSLECMCPRRLHRTICRRPVSISLRHRPDAAYAMVGVRARRMRLPRACFVPIMAAILFPVFAQARHAARAKACMSNERQIGLAITMYSHDYDETMPDASRWIPELQHYTGPSPGNVSLDPLYTCPEVRSEGRR